MCTARPCAKQGFRTTGRRVPGARPRGCPGDGAGGPSGPCAAPRNPCPRARPSGGGRAAAEPRSGETGEDASTRGRRSPDRAAKIPGGGGGGGGGHGLEGRDRPAGAARRCRPGRCGLPPLPAQGREVRARTARRPASKPGRSRLCMSFPGSIGTGSHGKGRTRNPGKPDLRVPGHGGHPAARPGRALAFSRRGAAWPPIRPRSPEAAGDGSAAKAAAVAGVGALRESAGERARDGEGRPPDPAAAEAAAAFPEPCPADGFDPGVFKYRLRGGRRRAAGPGRRARTFIDPSRHP